MIKGIDCYSNSLTMHTFYGLLMVTILYHYTKQFSVGQKN